MAIRFLLHLVRDRLPRFLKACSPRFGSCALLFWLAAMAMPLQADGTNAAPAHPQPALAHGEDFGQYLVQHQADLAPFFTKHADELIKQAVPPLLGLMGWIMVFTVLIGWGIDVLLGRGFSAFFAPAFARFKQAMIYATGRLVLSVVFTLAIVTGILFSLGLDHGGWIGLGVGIFGVALALAAQVTWIVYLYRSNIPISSFFYLAIIVVHFIAGCIISIPVIGARASSLATDFVDNSITPKIRSEIESNRQELAAAQATRNEAQAKVDDVQNQIAQAQAEQARLRKEIEEKKNSDTYVFSQIVKVDAQGDLNSAREQLIDFLAKFPSGSAAQNAQAQLTHVEAELAAQAAQKKQDEENAALAAAQARADLVARAGKGEVTLSEMRQALFGKSREEVKALFGLPTETASDSWSYRQQMIFNPLTNERRGLTIYFFEGAVQSVDNYGGGAR